MLYEVITIDATVMFVDICNFVITSYSIHYTKLYEPWDFLRGPPGRAPAPTAGTAAIIAGPAAGGQGFIAAANQPRRPRPGPPGRRCGKGP